MLELSMKVSDVTFSFFNITK